MKYLLFSESENIAVTPLILKNSIFICDEEEFLELKDDFKEIDGLDFLSKPFGMICKIMEARKLDWFIEQITLLKEIKSNSNIKKAIYDKMIITAQEFNLKNISLIITGD